MIWLRERIILKTLGNLVNFRLLCINRDQNRLHSALKSSRVHSSPLAVERLLAETQFPEANRCMLGVVIEDVFCTAVNFLFLFS